jgi:ABC-type dipeptide/oligopeptide/nickel transport system permease component
MTQYLVRRLLLAWLTLLLVTLIVFTLLRVVVPLVYADAADLIAGEYGRQDPALRAKLKQEYGLSASVPAQYLEFLGRLARGDLGRSLFNGRSVAGEIRDRLPVSIELGLVGLLSGLLFSIPMGIAAAVQQDRWPDYILRTLAILLNAMPGFWLAILIITFGSIWFNWAPPLDFAYFHDDPIAHIKIMALPALLIGLTPSAGLVRLMRTQMLEVMRQDYIRTAHAKGLTGRVVIARHALRNALIPIVTVIGLTIPTLAAGTAIFESIFVLPGMGRYLVSAVGNLDYPVILSTNVIFATLIVLSNLIVDLSYTLIDPRIRY